MTLKLIRIKLQAVDYGFLTVGSASSRLQTALVENHVPSYDFLYLISANSE